MTRLDAGILAAGVGSRFQVSGVRTPKPLIPVAGRPLIGWVLEAYRSAGLKGATILLHPRSAGARSYAESFFPELDLRWVLKATPSTLATFCEVTGRLQGSRFLLSTADAVYRPSELSRFLEKALKRRADLVLGVTRHNLDATSLIVEADRRGVARALRKGGGGALATTGVYLCGAGARDEARKALEAGVPSLSSFLGLAPFRGLRVEVVEMPEVFDVDRPEDVRAAERLFVAGDR